MSVAEMVGKHADLLDAAAAAMEKDGIGGDLRNGHRLFLTRMAASMRSEAAQGKVPHGYNSYSDVDVYAAADKPPLLPAVVAHIMASNGIHLENGRIAIGALDAAMKNAPSRDRFILKTALARAGRLTP
jgi:hypothetical protein